VGNKEYRDSDKHRGNQEEGWKGGKGEGIGVGLIECKNFGRVGKRKYFPLSPYPSVRRSSGKERKTYPKREEKPPISRKKGR